MASRQPVRNRIGGSPTSSVKRRASAARETPVPAASDATVQGWAGLLWIMRSARPTTGSLCARYQAGVPASGRANQARRTAISSRSSRLSSTASWPGSSLTIRC
jgi:hypothetical protein